ncbi:MAG: peptide chain release factor 1 [Candidatus Coatesbacteria bacterium 4484_99]|uniref:Peptide chain release factor 1 n=1 Tax=Candidatus Coatesbacteria bacterium 4484_99 TaxID=1970774 RepID=A0A1W9S2L0_9BACT|nr:MAG: peptide chain release factor 1 [Candidatus Coatesbacteria bacterium 4484_99]
MLDGLKEKMDELLSQYERLKEEVAKPEVYQDAERVKSVSKRLRELEKVVDLFRQYQSIEKEIDEYRAIIGSDDDEELIEIARQGLDEAEEKLAKIEEELRYALVPADPYEDRNVIMEIRAGTGGDEATLFAGELFRMYERYATENGYKVRVLSSHESEVGGFKEIIFSVEGKGAFSRLKHESGVHRVQRVPVTESSGRIHTSAVTVAVLPEAEEVEVDIKSEDIEVDVFRASGPGGQHVNVTDSAVRITHLPTGIVVSCQDERSQHQNRAKAMSILRARLLDLRQREQMEERASKRRDQIKTGDRSERVRTYNFPQNRVTDHRINLTLYSLDSILAGDLDPLIEPLIIEDRKRKMEEAME